jgi:Dyp-type peroxidase family
VKAGEFILGYANEYNQYSERPLIRDDGPAKVLPKAEDNSMLRDLGRNGTYMVFRQMHQDVHGFWSALDQLSKAPDGSSDPAAMVELASKMVGRWPSGAPLANSPDKDAPELQDDDNFMYHKRDPHGTTTPFASHIRRSNPRDMLGPDPGSEKSIAIGNRHRIVRRGRAYGPPLVESMDPAQMLSRGDDGQDRGLHFICFNTNIGRQFEFLYQTWVNNKRFAGMYDEADPVIGDADPTDSGESTDFRVPGHPVRQRYSGLKRPVKIKGGAFFFMPGIRAIRYLAALPNPS